MFNSVLELIGNTPLICLSHFNPTLNAYLYAKCEMFNPTLSIKDRIVLSMIRHYEQIGKLKVGDTIYEASSGNTGSSLAMIAAVLGYKAIITVPEKTSIEKIQTMKAYGAVVIVCKHGVSSDSPEHYSNKARILSENHPGSIYLNQYDSEENVQTHYYSTALELWKQMKYKIDYFVATASSGGTITGVGRFLKEKNPHIKIVLADPIGSVFYDYFHKKDLTPQTYCVEGAGKDKICSIHNFEIIDEVIQFSDKEAFDAVKRLMQTEGIFSGGSSGGVLVAAEKLAANFNSRLKPRIAVILPDSGFKYLSKSSD